MVGKKIKKITKKSIAKKSTKNSTIKKETLIIIVASQNPVKIKATEIAFEKMFPEKIIDCTGKDISSNISNQPMSSDDTLLGARNRVNNAAINFPDADFWVGIEGGINPYEDTYITFPWIIVSSKKYNYESRILGSSFLLPKKIAAMIDEGIELGHASDKLFNKTNHKQKSGSVGLLTNNVITRKEYYVTPLTLSLIPFKNPKLYELHERNKSFESFFQ